MLEGQHERAPAAHRDALNRAAIARAYGAIGLFDVRNQVLNDGVFIAHAVLGIQIKTVAAGGRDDDELADQSLLAQAGNLGRNAAPFKLAFVAEHAMQEIEHRVAPLRIRLVRRRQHHGIFQVLAERG